MKKIAQIVFSGLVSLFFGIPALAANDDLILRERIETHTSKFRQAQAKLEGMDPEDWSDEDVELYLRNALFAIYNGVNLYIDDYYQHPIDADVLQRSGILTEWPGNPFCNWEPITWSAADSSFSAGNIYLQMCPPSEYSLARGTDIEIPLSFMMSMFGSSADYTPISIPVNLFNWSSIPHGAIFTVGSQHMTAENIRVRREAVKKYREQQAANESSQEEQSSETEQEE